MIQMCQDAQILVLSSPQAPSPKPKNPELRGLGLTLKSHGPLLSMKEGSHNEPQKVRKVQSGPPYLSSRKNLRCTARGRTWSSPPCSVRTSSVLLVVKPRPQTPKPHTQKPKKGPWADTKIS